jgi:hypothetical protein
MPSELANQGRSGCRGKSPSGKRRKLSLDISHYLCMIGSFCGSIDRLFWVGTPPWRRETRGLLGFKGLRGAAKRWSLWAWG